MANIERSDQWLNALAHYLSREDRFTTDTTVPHGESTVEGLKRAAADLRGAVDALREIAMRRDTAEGVIAVEALAALGIATHDADGGRES